MIKKHAILGIFQKLMVFCATMFFLVVDAFATGLPSRYQQVEWLSSTKAISITGFKTKDTQTFKAGFMRTKNTAQYLYYSDTGSSGTTNTTAYLSSGGNWRFDGTTISVTANVNTAYNSIQNKDGLWLNDEKIGTYTNVDSFTSTDDLKIFGMESPAPLRLYYLQVEENSVKTLDLIPVKDLINDVYGLYDLVGGNFYTNANATITGGDPVANTCPGGTLQTYTTVTATDVPAGVQNGTPTPTNPITPTFYTQGKMTLRRIGDYADSYDATTGKITRRVGVKVLNGTEDWTKQSGNNRYLFTMDDTNLDNNFIALSTHFVGIKAEAAWSQMKNGNLKRTKDSKVYAFQVDSIGSVEGWQQYLASQYAAGTPVTMYYPLATPVEEDWAAEQCDMPIKIATRAYNTTQFAPVVTALNSAIDTIKDVVTNTINQTAAVSALQSTKQTRPDEECPAGKKCLLVEDVDGTPHWYEIIENIYGLPSGYTPLEYIQSTGTQYIDTGILLSNTDVFEITFQSLNTLETPVMGAISGGASYTSTNNLSVTYTVASGLSDYSVYCDGAAGNANYSWSGGNRSDGLKHTIKYNGLNTAPTLDGVPMTQITPTTLVANTPTVTTWLFGRNNTSTGTLSQSGVRIYDFHIHNKGHFVPAQNSSGVVGMYNVLDNNPATAFHTNQGTGTFTAGPEI